jgi:hypothetical protein
MAATEPQLQQLEQSPGLAAPRDVSQNESPAVPAAEPAKGADVHEDPKAALKQLEETEEQTMYACNICYGKEMLILMVPGSSHAC